MFKFFIVFSFSFFCYSEKWLISCRGQQNHAELKKKNLNRIPTIEKIGTPTPPTQNIWLNTKQIPKKHRNLTTNSSNTRLKTEWLFKFTLRKNPQYEPNPKQQHKTKPRTEKNLFRASEHTRIQPTLVVRHLYIYLSHVLCPES